MCDKPCENDSNKCCGIWYPIQGPGFITYMALWIAMTLSLAYLATVIGFWYYFGKTQNRGGDGITVQSSVSKNKE